LFLYAVSANEEFVALPGAADGGMTPLFAAESGEPLACGAVFALL